MSPQAAHILLLYVLVAVTILLGLVLWREVIHNSEQIKSEAQLAQISREIASARVQVLDAANEANCRELNTFKGGLRTIIERSQKSLPENVYYADKPQELARAQADNKAILLVLKNRDC